MKEKLDQIKLTNEDLEKQLDKNLELFKRLEFEKELDEAIKKLEKLSEEQKDLSEETRDKKKPIEDIKEKQEDINKKFDELRSELDDIHKKNEELEDPFSFEKTDEDEEAIEEELDKSSEKLDKESRKKASQQQKKAGEMMEELSNKMSGMQDEMYQEELGEDIDALREILENLIQLSFDQEDLITRVNETSTIDPKYIEIISSQSKLQDDMAMVEDSLFELSKRQPAIENVIMNEIDIVNSNIENAISNLTDRRINIAAGNQQFAMTSINNLALLLSEALNQMMQSMQAQCSGQCSKGNPKPGAGKASAKSMRQMQEQLNKQLEQLKKGQKPGKGENGEQGESSMSEKLARMAAEQGAIRSMMQEYQGQLKEQGLNDEARELDELMKEMDQTETEIVNKIITQETLKRQKDILSRLLKQEKAELERRKEEKRESKEAKDVFYSNPNEFLEYKRLKSNEVELLRTIPPNLRTFYRNKVNEYYFNFEIN